MEQDDPFADLFGPPPPPAAQEAIVQQPMGSAKSTNVTEVAASPETQPPVSAAPNAQTPQYLMLQEDVQDSIKEAVSSCVDAAVTACVGKLVNGMRDFVHGMTNRMEALELSVDTLKDDFAKLDVESLQCSMNSRLSAVDEGLKNISRSVQAMRDHAELLETQQTLASLKQQKREVEDRCQGCKGGKQQSSHTLPSAATYDSDSAPAEPSRASSVPQPAPAPAAPPAAVAAQHPAPAPAAPVQAAAPPQMPAPAPAPVATHPQPHSQPPQQPSAPAQQHHAPPASVPQAPYQHHNPPAPSQPAQYGQVQYGAPAGQSASSNHSYGAPDQPPHGSQQLYASSPVASAPSYPAYGGAPPRSHSSGPPPPQAPQYSSYHSTPSAPPPAPPYQRTPPPAHGYPVQGPTPPTSARQLEPVSQQRSTQQVVADICEMGFRRDQVEQVLQRMIAQGKGVDLNAVVDTLMAERR